MQKIKIIVVGKTKAKSFIELEKEFSKRLSVFCKLQIIEVKEESISKHSDKDKLIEAEEVRIRKNVSEDEELIVLDETGENLSSLEFAKLMKSKKDFGKKLCFIIGGAFGLSKSFKEEAKILLSLSKMTFTHQMVRIFLLEQIYRSFAINTGKEYHH